MQFHVVSRSHMNIETTLLPWVVQLDPFSQRNKHASQNQKRKEQTNEFHVKVNRRDFNQDWIQCFHCSSFHCIDQQRFHTSHFSQQSTCLIPSNEILNHVNIDKQRLVSLLFKKFIVWSAIKHPRRPHLQKLWVRNFISKIRNQISARCTQIRFGPTFRVTWTISSKKFCV